MSVLTHLDLFSGIGGFSLGLERTGGFKTVAFCEIDGWCRQQLARNWPGVPIYSDIRSLNGKTIGYVDIITGGFPCQDISPANTSAKGIDGARSGLVFELLRVIREVRPTWVVIENSPTLRVRGADRVLDELEGQGYACWPLVVGARHVLAPHRRDRAWIVAHSERRAQTEQRRRVEGNDGLSPQQEATSGPRDGGARTPPNTFGCGIRIEQQRVPERRTARGVRDERQAKLALHAHSHLDRQPQQSIDGQMGRCQSVEGNDEEPWGWWNGGPGAHLSMDDGLSTRVARRWLKAYGNSVVPAIVEALGGAILAQG